MTPTINPDWSIGSKEPSKRQITEWERVKSIVSRVGQGLYLSGFPDDAVISRMKELDIQVMFSCTRAEPPFLPGVAILRIPFDDNVGELPDMTRITFAAEAIVKLLNEGESVLVHCMYGLNRSALLAGYVLALRHPSMSGDDILRQIRMGRPGALHNALYAHTVQSLNKVDL